MTTALHDLMTRTPGLPCREQPEPFFSPDQAERQYAARECHRCPLLLACMRYALAADEQYGVWGGVDFEARAMGCGTARGYRNHIRHREPACAPCQAAYDESVEANRRRLLEIAHRAGGTVRGYWMHRRLGEEACEGCKRAQGRKSAERRERQRAAAQGPRSAPVALIPAEPLPGPQSAVQPLALAG